MTEKRFNCDIDRTTNRNRFDVYLTFLLGAPKKGKRPAWDIQGQVNDLKEQLAAAQQKEATIDDILKRLDVRSLLFV